MPLVPFAALPADARVWVFASSDPLDGAAVDRLLNAVDAYLAQWKAHGAPLTVGRDWRDAHFLLIGVDQRTAGASGCSIDALYRTLQQLEGVLGTPLVAGGRVFWRGNDGTVRVGTRDQFGAAGARGEITGATRVFDTTVASLAQVDEQFERAAADSWHAQLLPAAAS